MKETTKIEYRIQDEHHGGGLQINLVHRISQITTVCEVERVISGLDDIDIDWEKHNIEITTYKIQETRKK